VNFTSCPLCKNKLTHIKKLTINTRAHHIIKKCTSKDHNFFIAFNSLREVLRYRLRIQFDDDPKHQFIILFHPHSNSTTIEQDRSFGSFKDPPSNNIIVFDYQVNFNFKNRKALIKKLHFYFTFI